MGAAQTGEFAGEGLWQLERYWTDESWRSQAVEPGRRTGVIV
jgi:hypothetical protein